MPDTETPSLPELLESQQQVIRQRRRRRRSTTSRWIRRIKRWLPHTDLRIVALMIISFAAAIAMSGLVLSISARNQVDNSWQNLNRVWTSVSQAPGTELTLADFERLQSAVNDLNGSLSSAKRRTLFLRPFSSLNANLAVTLKTLDAAQELSWTANDILTALEPAVFFLTEGEQEEALTTQLSSGERIVELLGLGRGRFLDADQHLASAENLINGFDVANVSPNLLVTVDELSQYHQQLLDINRMLSDSPDLLTAALGLMGTKTYLILSQNSDELRPSGGYLSTYGWMTVRNGRLLDYSYSPTTSTSPNPPPDELASDVQVPDWWIQYTQPIYAAWDGSWYPDFPSTARMAAWYYDNGGNPHSPVDGVIGIDVAGFEYLLQGLGQVVVPEYNEVVTADNFRDVIYRIRAEGEGELAHKRFLAALYSEILSAWQSADQKVNIEVRGALLRALQEKHIMIYFTDDNLNQAIDVLGWSGRQNPGVDNDYLQAVDANLGNKADRSVIRQLTYDVEIMPDGTLHSRTAIAYDYSARVAENDPAARPEHGSINYNSILQVFVPANSVLTGTNNLRFEPATVTSDTHTDFVARVGVEYNQSERFQFAYTTPVMVEHFGPYRRYKLVLQKQPGTLNELANVQITLPSSARTIHTSPQAAASYSLEQPILEFRVDLTTDQEIEVIYVQ
jgi:hypothetical protein